MDEMKQMNTLLAVSMILILLSSSAASVSGSADFSFASSTNQWNVSTYRAVLVGIGSSQGLPYSVQQLKGFSTTLLHGGLFKKDNIQMLFDGQATAAAIYEKLQWLADTADGNDVSLFYFVGHGSRNYDNAFLHASDTLIADEDLALSMQNISGSLVVIIDTCYSGGFIDDLEEVNRTILTACADDESTYQVHDLQSGMFGFFFNLSLAWFSKNIEGSFLIARFLTIQYGSKISQQYDEDYMVYPQRSDNDKGLTFLLLKHAYARQLLGLLHQMIDTDGFNQFWRMKQRADKGDIFAVGEGGYER